MGLLERCYQAYEKNKAQVGKPSTSLRTGWEAPVLLPVAHTTQKVNIEVSLAADGTFRTAGVVLAADMTTVICSTLQAITPPGAARKSPCGRNIWTSCGPGVTPLSGLTMCGLSCGIWRRAH